MNSNELAAAAQSATQINLDEAVTTEALRIAAYQAAIREGRTYYFVQIIGLGYQAFTSMDDALEAGRPVRNGSMTALAHKRFEPTGEIVEVKVDGTEKAPRAGFLAGLVDDLANVDQIAAIAKSLPRR